MHLQAPETQRWGTRFYPYAGGGGRDNSKLLLVLVDMFTGCVEAFPYKNEKVREVIAEIIV
jgi:hypothetical protein